MKDKSSSWMLTFAYVPLSLLLSKSRHSTKIRGDRLSPCRIPLLISFSRISLPLLLIDSFHRAIVVSKKLLIHVGKISFLMLSDTYKWSTDSNVFLTSTQEVFKELLWCLLSARLINTCSFASFTLLTVHSWFSVSNPLFSPRAASLWLHTWLLVYID